MSFSYGIRLREFDQGRERVTDDRVLLGVAERSPSKMQIQTGHASSSLERGFLFTLDNVLSQECGQGLTSFGAGARVLPPH
jgi:hypothetical protein